MREVKVRPTIGSTNVRVDVGETVVYLTNGEAFDLMHQLSALYTVSIVDGVEA